MTDSPFYDPDSPGDNSIHRGGLYVHVPFCVRKCPYCDFYSDTDISLKAGFVNAVTQEMALATPIDLLFDTIYLGGGTPSLLDPPEVERILNTVYKHFQVSPKSEITIEVNPGTINSEKLNHYHALGVNRINIGVQSFMEDHLAFLGRIHSSKDARTAIHLAGKAGFDNVGVDLIYGLPGQTRTAWLSDLKETAALHPEHISCYMLTFESGTPMDALHRSGKLVGLSDDKVKSLFIETVEFLSANSYLQYEISNFSRIKPNIQETERTDIHQSCHNRKYWSGAPYIGFGPSAHSFISPVRHWNIKSTAGYIDLVCKGERPIVGEEILNKEQMMIEALYLGLRTTSGVDIKRFDETFQVGFHSMFKDILDDLENRELLITTEDRSKLTLKGMLFLDNIAGILIESLDESDLFKPDTPK